MTLYQLSNRSYGMALAKEKNEEEAMRWFIRSVHLYPMNWGCWLEMTSLIGRVEDVSAFHLTLPATANVNSLIGYPHTFHRISSLLSSIFTPRSSYTNQHHHYTDNFSNSWQFSQHLLSS